MNSRHNKVPDRCRGSRLNARNELLFQPWFLPKHITYKIHGLMPPQYWKKMRYYFEDWGCIVCGSEGRYHSNGMCVRCYVKTSRRLSQSIRRHSKSVGANQRLDLELFRQEKLAKRLLADFRDSNASRGRRMIDPYRTCNPVYETFLRHREPAVA
jgi:hypothetical protein